MFFIKVILFCFHYKYLWGRMNVSDLLFFSASENTIAPMLGLKFISDRSRGWFQYWCLHRSSHINKRKISVLSTASSTIFINTNIYPKKYEESHSHKKPYHVFWVQQCKAVDEVVLKCGLQKLNLRHREHLSTYG